MDHHPIHWGYSSTPTQQNTWIPPHPVKKRTISDSECDDVYSEESSSKEHYDIVSPERSSTGESDSCQLLSRKRRRGVIEKKRRDKINSSLSELKRLVPTAYEKQGSAKLEKAEILQLTVDHLKGLHSKGIDSMSIDPQRYALEYNIIGLRECAAEVSRYLVTIEGMDIQDPLRLRLMSHLQCFVAQREISAKNGTSASSWVPGTYQTGPAATAYGPSLPPPPPSTSASTSSTTYHQNYLSSQPSTSSSSSNSYIPNLSSSTMPVSPIHQQHCNTSSVPLSPTTTTNTTALLQSTHVPPSTSLHHHHHHHPHQHHHNLHHDPYNQYPITHDSQQGPIYTDLSSSRGSLSTLGYPQYPPTAPQGYPPHSGSLTVGSYNGNTMKPYRPWGAEMAY